MSIRKYPLDRRLIPAGAGKTLFIGNEGDVFAGSSPQVRGKLG